MDPEGYKGERTMMRERTDKLNDKMVEIIKYHLPGKSEDTLTWYKSFKHDTVYKLGEDGKIDWMVSYFILDFNFDTMIIMQRNNQFPKELWKIMKNTIYNRSKPIRIMSDPNNKVLVKGAERHGGTWHNDEIWFY